MKQTDNMKKKPKTRTIEDSMVESTGVVYTNQAEAIWKCPDYDYDEIIPCTITYPLKGKKGK